MSKRKNSLIENAAEVVEQVAEQVTPVLESAVEMARERLDDGMELLQEVREDAAVKLAEVREDAAVKLAAAREEMPGKLAAARDEAAVKLAEGRQLAATHLAEGRELAAAKLAEVRHEEPPKSKGGKLKWVIGGTLLAAVGAVLVKRKQEEAKAGNNWDSTVTPTRDTTSDPSTPAAAAGEGLLDDRDFAADSPADDVAAATPDEALADNVTEPHPDTTPDNPAEVVEIDPPAEGSEKS